MSTDGMTAKTQIADALGEHALVLPALLGAALVANERAKYVLTTLQMAANQAQTAQASPPSLRKEREACAITDASFDRTIVQAEYDGRGNYHIPGARRLMAILDDAVRTMLAPFGVGGNAPAEAALHAKLEDRLERLIAARPAVLEDMLTAETIASLTSARPNTGDGFHVLVLDLHKEINRLQSAISTMEVAGAKAYGLAESDRAVLDAFMAGVNRTAPLKFDHPGLDTIATRSGGELLIQNDLGTTAAHVLVLKVAGPRVTVTHTDIHLPRVRFLQALCADAGIRWENIRSRQAPVIAGGELFYLAFGEFTAADTKSLTRFLERLGSRIVFLIDWNKARKRLRMLVPNEVALDILTWAADHEFGHRGFLQLGGERLIYDALEQAIKTPLRYGQPLHEMIGSDVARDYLRFVLQITATGLLERQSEALIRDRVRAELFTHFRSAGQRLLAECSRHAGLVVQMADGLRAGLRQSGAVRSEALAEHAARAKQWETSADDVVKEVRSTVRRISGTEIFGHIIETADDAADDLEDAAFLGKLLFESATLDDLPEPLLVLSDLLAEGTQAFRRMMETAQYVHRGGQRDAVQRFLESADRVATVEHQSDERERDVTAKLMSVPRDARQLNLLSAIARHLESAADALSHASLKLRDHILGDVMFA